MPAAALIAAKKLALLIRGSPSPGARSCKLCAARILCGEGLRARNGCKLAHDFRSIRSSVVNGHGVDGVADHAACEPVRGAHRAEIEEEHALIARVPGGGVPDDFALVGVEEKRREVHARRAASPAVGE